MNGERAIVQLNRWQKHIPAEIAGCANFATSESSEEMVRCVVRGLNLPKLLKINFTNQMQLNN